MGNKCTSGNDNPNTLKKLRRSKQNKDPIQGDFDLAIDSNNNGRDDVKWRK